MKRPIATRRRLAVVLAVLGAAAAVVLAGGGTAATPSAGTVSTSSPTVSWDGDNKIPTAGQCTGPTDPSCDAYKLTIQAPATTFQVKIVLQPFAGDWDLSVWAPDGGLAGSSGNAPGQKEIIVLSNPASGTYTVTAAPFAPAPGVPPYTASAELYPVDPDGQGTPSGEHLTFSNHPAPAPLGQDAGEPSIGANPKSGNVMFQAGLEALRVKFDDATSPAKDTWTDVSFPTSSSVSLDPIGFMDRGTGRWFSSQLSGTTSLAALTDDDGATWLPSEGGPLNGGVDHQTIGGGPFHAPLTRDPKGLVYPNAVYYCSQDLVAALCARSDNGGLTFAPAVPIYTSECTGLHGHVKVAPDGTVYVPNKNCGGHQGVVVSEDNGVTWDVRTIPSSTPGEWDPYVAIGSDGTLYVAYGDGDGHPKVAISHDRGKTFTRVSDVGSSAGIAHTAFPVAAAGDPDRMAMAFLGTTYPGAGAMGDDPSWPGVWYVYVAETFDGGATWSTVNATPNDPVQRGTICGGGFGGCDNGTRNMLDFNDATVDGQGRFLVAYADGCVGACITSGPGSFTAIATIVRQVSGKRLFAAFDSLAAPAAPLLYAKATTGQPPSNVLSWQEPDDHGSAITSYRVYRNGTLLATVDGTARGYTDTAIVSGTSYTYAVSAVNGVGEGPKSPAVTPVSVAPPPVQDPCKEPGVSVLTDPTGDSTGGDPAKDVQGLSILETQALGAGKMAFVLKVASLQSVPANTAWPVLFKGGDGADHWVRMRTDALGTVSFGYGNGTSYTGTQAGAADAASTYAPDGTIRIVVPRSVVGAVPGKALTEFLTRISVYTPAGSLTPDNMPDSLARTGSYTVKGNENCVTPKPDLVVGAADIGFVQQDGKNGKIVTIVATVHNLGNAAASSVPVRIAVDGVTIATPTATSIAAGSFAKVSAQWDTRGQKGDHTVTATADPANAIAESSETNNTGSRVVTVKGSTVG